MKCPLCRSLAHFFTNGDQREYHHCSNCRLIFVPPGFFIPRDDELRRYSLHQNNLENKGYVAMFQEKIEIVKRVCPKVKTVLDYGCGRDMVLKTLLTQQGYEEVDGYDPNFLPEQKLKPKYDLIISTEAFEHFKEPCNEVERIASRLAPSGYAAIMTQFYTGSTALPDNKKFNSWYYKRDPTHIVFYSTETFAWLARHWGFKIIFNNQKDFVVLQSAVSDHRPRDF